jgi:ketosteroid isomerase-like protein
MSAAENKKLLEEIYAALAWGDSKPFVHALADDFAWIVKGENAWAGEWRGKHVVRDDLFAPLFAQFEGQYTNKASRFIAEGDTVVVECQGNVATKSGARYDNTYCIIYTLENGKLKQAVEYMDTALAERVLTPLAR